MVNESRCGGNCPFTAITSPKECAVLHHEVEQALESVKELRMEFTKLDKNAAVLTMRVTIISSVIGSAVALAVRFIII